MSDRIAVLGSGHMGRALAVGIARNPQLDASIIVSDHNQEQLTGYTSQNVRTTTNNEHAISESDIVILAVKPQVIKSVVTTHADAINGRMVVSIAAGVPLSSLEDWLPESTPIVHCMPNLAVSLGEGITGMYANRHVTESHKTIVQTIFKSLGEAVWMSDDSHIDIVTAVSGTGLAYFFYLMDAIIHAAKELGMDEKNAQQFATRTALGAARIAVNSNDDPATLRDQVASPGGTTERALSVLDKNRVRESIIDAVRAAFARSAELTASL